MVQPPHLSSQATTLVTRSLSSNATITCVANGLEYFVYSSSPNLITCESILRNTTMSVTNSANDRSVTGILWSCLTTVFVCTWVSVHPNIPHPDATEWQIRRDRFLMMVCGLIAPELIVLWALRQWIGARFLVRKMREKNIQGFTGVHGHFMQMGGFMQYSKGARMGIIGNHNQLIFCIVNWKFILPTAAEIQDRSKGDGLSKVLVVGQTAWFVAQCLARRLSGLAITEMELVTLAFAALNGIIHFLWWNKPLDVRYAVQVVRPCGDSGLDIDKLLHQNSFAAATSSPEVSRDSRGRLRIDDLQGVRRTLVNSQIGRLLSAVKSNFRQGDEERVHKHLRISALHSNCDPQDTFAATAVASTIGILFGTVHCIAWNFHFPSPHERTLWRVWSAIITTIPALLLVKSATGYLYVERILGRYGATANSRIGVITSTTRLGRALLSALEQISRFSMWATILATPAYVAARVGLLVQVLVALRDLQPAERAQVQWADFLPHL